MNTREYDNDREDPAPAENSGGYAPRRFSASVVLTFFILFALWIAFSGRFDGFHLTLGLISCAIVSVFCRDFWFSSPTPGIGTFLLWIRFINYIPWLLYQIFLANLHVLYLVFHPRMMDRIDPHIIEFDSHLKSDYARTTFADSITLTPGTITVNVTELGRFFVHCIDSLSGEPLPGEMQNRIGKVFKE